MRTSRFLEGAAPSGDSGARSRSYVPERHPHCVLRPVTPCPGASRCPAGRGTPSAGLAESAAPWPLAPPPRRCPCAWLSPESPTTRSSSHSSLSWHEKDLAARGCCSEPPPGQQPDSRLPQGPQTWGARSCGRANLIGGCWPSPAPHLSRHPRPLLGPWRPTRGDPKSGCHRQARCSDVATLPVPARA